MLLFYFILFLQNALLLEFNKVWGFKFLLAPNFDSFNSCCKIYAGLHAINVSSMMEIFRVLVQYGVVNVKEKNSPKALEMGCGLPFLAMFLQLIGCDVNAIDLPPGVLEHIVHLRLCLLSPSVLVIDAINKQKTTINPDPDHPISKIVFQGVDLSKKNAYKRLMYKHASSVIFDLTGNCLTLVIECIRLSINFRFSRRKINCTGVLAKK